MNSGSDIPIVRGPTPRGLPDPVQTNFANSYTYLIRNVLLERLKILEPFHTDVAKYSTTNDRPVQDEHIPYLGVYLVPVEELTGIGENNIGPPKFDHQAIIGFSYFVVNNDTAQTENILDQAHWAIMSLLHDQDWAKWPTTMAMPKDYQQMVRGITRITRAHVYGTAGKQNTTPVGELQMEWTLTYETSWEPIIPDVLESILFKAVYPWPEDPNRQAVTAEWAIETGPESVPIVTLWANQNGQPEGTPLNFMVDVMTKIGPLPIGTVHILIDGVEVASGTAGIGLPDFANGLRYTTADLAAGIYVVTANFIATDGINANNTSSEWIQTVI